MSKPFQVRPKPECSNCYWWMCDLSSGLSRNVCKRHAPVLVPNLMKPDGPNCEMYATKWPQTYGFDVCGEHEPGRNY